jgi:predicted kinase
MKKVILTRGLPASGKSTWAKKLIDDNPGMYKRISKDDLRSMLDNSKWSKGNEKFVLKVRDTLILESLEAGYHVIVDDTNLSDKHERTIKELVKGLATVEIQDFTDIPLEVCIERDLQRLHSVGERVIRRWYNDYLKPKPPIIEYNPSLPDAAIVDIDGTLALINGRNPYDTAKCEEDGLNKPIVDIIVKYTTGHYESVSDNDSCTLYILLVSGRSEEYRPQTEAWLKKHEISYDELYMRKNDDNRKDAIIKREIYDEHIKDKYNVRFALDDRNQTVAVWRSLGLVCLQVADGDF